LVLQYVPGSGLPYPHVGESLVAVATGGDFTGDLVAPIE
jgi:hypothetical protein